MPLSIYHKLLDVLGPQDWWPADTWFEVVIGAILTQQTRWDNVEKAINKLKEKDLIEPSKIAGLSKKELEELIKCTGFYRQKAERLQIASKYFADNYDNIKNKSTETLRSELLSLKGIGKETADSILLYALDRPAFVIDAYTVRMCKGIGVTGNYDQLQRYFEDNLPRDLELFKEFHALIVEFGKQYCNQKRCDECILLK